MADSVFRARDDLRARRDHQLQIRARQSFLSTVQLQRADLDRAWCGVSVSGEHVDHHVDAGAARVLDRGHSVVAPVAQPSSADSQPVTSRADWWTRADSESSVTGIRLVLVRATRISPSGSVANPGNRARIVLSDVARLTTRIDRLPAHRTE